MPTASVQRLQDSVERLNALIRRWSNARWGNPATDGRPRAEIAYQLALTLAELARQAGNSAPPIAPPRVAPHAIADQLVVLARELTSAPDAGSVAEAADAAIERAVNSF